MNFIDIEYLNNHHKKDTIGAWVKITDAKTNQPQPRHIDLSAFPISYENRDGNLVETALYTTFFANNNSLVRQAIAEGLDFGEEYRSFFEYGLRISQQLPGKFRDKTLEIYHAKQRAVEEKLKAHVVDTAAKFRIDELEQIVTDDLEMGETLKRLKEYRLPFPDKVNGNDDLGNRILAYKKETEILPQISIVPKALQHKFAKLALLGTVEPGTKIYSSDLATTAMDVQEMEELIAAKYLDLVYNIFAQANADHNLLEEIPRNISQIGESSDHYVDALLYVVGKKFEPCVAHQMISAAADLSEKYGAAAIKVIDEAPLQEPAENALTRHVSIGREILIAQQVQKHFIAKIRA